MPSSEYLFLTILGCTVATWLSRILPFLLLKKISLPQKLLEYLSFVPIVIMSALWFSSLFEQRIGHLPSLNLPYLFASFPTILAAILSKNLLIIVLVGIASRALKEKLRKQKQVRQLSSPDLHSFSGANERIRTADLRITSALLYQLS